MKAIDTIVVATMLFLSVVQKEIRSKLMPVFAICTSLIIIEIESQQLVVYK